jgi:hypothetical protein
MFGYEISWFPRIKVRVFQGFEVSGFKCFRCARYLSFEVSRVAGSNV